MQGVWWPIASPNTFIDRDSREIEVYVACIAICKYYEACLESKNFHRNFGSLIVFIYEIHAFRKAYLKS
jgi:hypothetical protein